MAAFPWNGWQASRGLGGRLHTGIGGNFQWNTQAAENIIHSTAVSAAERAVSPRDVVIMTPLDNVVPIRNRQDEIRHEVEDQLSKGVIDRAVDTVKGWFH